MPFGIELLLFLASLNETAPQTEDKVTEKVALFFCKKEKSMV